MALEAEQVVTIIPTAQPIQEVVVVVMVDLVLMLGVVTAVQVSLSFPTHHQIQTSHLLVAA